MKKVVNSQLLRRKLSQKIHHEVWIHNIAKIIIIAVYTCKKITVEIVNCINCTKEIEIINIMKIHSYFNLIVINIYSQILSYVITLVKTWKFIKDFFWIKKNVYDLEIYFCDSF